MADEPTTPEGQEPEGQNPTEPTNDQPNQTPDGQEPDGDEFDKERALETIRKLRAFEKQAKASERELAEYKRKEEEARQASLTEQQKLQEQLEQTRSELARATQERQDLLNRTEIQKHSNKLGIVDPEAAEKLLDWSAVDRDDQGRPTNLEEALAALVAERPWLKAQQQSQRQASPSNPATRTSGPGQRRYSADQLRDRDFYLANKADIEAAYREGRIDLG